LQLILFKICKIKQ